MLPSWVSRYVGVEFSPHGRTLEGCDCYGLVRIVLAEQFNVHLPRLDTEYEFGDAYSEELAINSQLFVLPVKKVEKPFIADLVFLRYFGNTSHIGLYVGDSILLHTAPKRNSCLDSLQSPFLKSRITAYYHVEGVSNCLLP